MIHDAVLMPLAPLVITCKRGAGAVPYWHSGCSVSDGDTIQILTAQKRAIKVRLHKVDSPESAQPFGNVSKQFTSKLVYCHGKDSKMKMTLITLFCSLLSFVVLTSGGVRAFQDEAKKTSGVVTERIGFVQDKPFDITVSSLPPKFMGHDPEALYRLLIDQLESPKSEFETTEQYKKRLDDAETNLSIGTLKVTDTFAFQAEGIKVISEFNADKLGSFSSV